LKVFINLSIAFFKSKIRVFDLKKPYKQFFKNIGI